MDGLPGVDDDFVAAQEAHHVQKKKDKIHRVLHGKDDRIVTAGEAEHQNDPSSAAGPTGSERELTLEEREEKWGFTLDELRSASKVVSVLFNNPALFVGDAYLSESRLYTMISRDRKTKRDNQAVYKQVMNEEKSRRERTQRQQDIETIKKTAMKQERDDALNALLIAPEDDGGDSTPLLITGIPPSATASPTTAHPSDPVREPSQFWLRLTGAAEAVSQLLSHTSQVPSTCSARLQSHLTATALRFVPHAFGSQMPTPLFLTKGTEGCDDAARVEGPLVVRSLMKFQLMIVALICRAEESETGAAGVLATPNTPCALPLAEGFLPFAVSDAHTLFKNMDIASQRAQCLSQLSVGGALDIFASPAFDCAVRTLAHTVLTILLENPSSQVRTTDASIQRLVADTFTLPRDAPLHPETILALLLQQWILPRVYRRVAEDIPRGGLDGALCEFIAERNELPPIANPTTGETEEYVPANEVEARMLTAAQYARPRLSPDELKMNRVQKCHTCKSRYQTLHPYYYSMCSPCGEFNYHKRLMTRDLRGKVVLLTGCRIKIGYAMAVSLLRCGAVLLGTTRFSHDALARFTEEPDYDEWKDRVHLFSLDLRDMWMVTQFCGFLTQRFPKLFAIINNAAQTIQRTPEYTAALRKQEAEPPQKLREAMTHDNNGEEWYHFFLRNTTMPVGLPLQSEQQHHHASLIESGDVSAVPADVSPFMVAEAAVAAASSAHQQGTVVATIVTPEQQLKYDRYDTQAEAMDLREKNSWTMQLHEVQGAEAAETMTINALSPFILNSKLKPLLLNRSGDADQHEGRFIINVSAMEGQFYRFKQTTHPHTNMAKAALNMMTRTSAEDYALSNIYMNSVDTGWITDESPVQKKQRRNDDFMLCPLDEVDAAARCLDLVYMDSKEYGKFWKDYHVIPW
jgi:NAD(P)-dependent dehydrogenase (short-subunit alcohol dehydrogenase family)